MVAVINPTTSLGAVSSVTRLAPYADDVVIAGMKSHASSHRHRPHGHRIDPVTSAAGVAVTGNNALDTGLSVAERTTNYIGMLPLIAMPVSMLGGGLMKLGGWTKFTPLTKAGTALKKPNHYLDNTTVEESFLRAPIRGTANVASSVVATPVAGITKVTRMDGWLQRRHTAQSAKQLEKAQGLLKGMDTAKLPEEMHTHVHELRGLVGNASSIEHVDVGRLENAIAAAKEGAASAGKAGKPLKKLAGNLEQSLSHHQSAGNWKDIKSYIKSTPEAIGKMNVGHTLMQGAWVAGSGISMASDARSFTKNLATLKQMYFDLTGETASTRKVLFGKVPTLVAQARSHIIKNTAIKESTDAAGLVVNVKGLLNPRFGGLKAMAAYMIPGLIGTGADMVMGESVLPAYQALRASFNPNKPMPVEYYASFIGTMTKDLKKRGGPESPFTQEVAKQYAEMHATPEQMLRDIESGELMKRVEAVIAASGQHAGPEHQVARKERPVVGKHTEKVIKNEVAAAAQHSAGPAVT